MLTKDPVITEIINEFKKAFMKLKFKKILLKSQLKKLKRINNIGENKNKENINIKIKSEIITNLMSLWGGEHELISISKKFEPFNLKKPINTKNKQIVIWIKLNIIALLKFNSNKAYWYIATSIVEYIGPPPKAITIAKLKKHKEKITEKTVNKFCFMIGISNLYIFAKKPRFKEFDIS